MTFKNKKIQKLVSYFLLVGLLAPGILLLKPTKTEAIGAGWVSDFFAPFISGSTGVGAGAEVTQTSFKIKEFAQDILRQVLMNLAQRSLQRMTASTVNWINSGFHGNPLFVENPQSFFGDIGKYEIKNIVNRYGYNSAQFPFGRQFSLNLVQSFRQTAENNAAYSLSRVINDPALLENYRRDFNFGGWDGFLLNTQYAQNNQLGFQIMATEQLARRFEGVAQTNVGKVKTTLEQGMGFLAPQVCPSNPRYNNLQNQFRRPSFSPTTPFRPPAREDFPATEEGEVEYQYAYQDYENQWNELTAGEKRAWEQSNTCPNGLVATTPGTVVASQINTALTSVVRNKELAAAMGNSISAILDSLISHFMGRGLNALTNRSNPEPEEDDWNYLGQTLGSPQGSNFNSWASGPDQEIILSEFREELERGINNTSIELLLMDNPSPSAPGIVQFLSRIWPKARELDICIPGPDMNWEERTDKEMERNATKLREKSDDDDPQEAAEAQLTYKELRFAVDFFKDWIYNKMIGELPNSIIFMDAVDEIRKLAQQDDELTDKRRTKQQALARTRSILAALSVITSQPEPDSAQERVMVSLWKQFNSVRAAVSSTATIEDTRNELNVAREKYERLGELITQCRGERGAKGWSPVNTTTRTGTATYLDQGSEQNLFCDDPIVGGYPHESFRTPNPGGSSSSYRRGRLAHIRAHQYPDVPLVNAENVFSFDERIGRGEVSIELKCNLIFKANVLDYKGSLPGTTTIPEPPSEHPPGEEEEEEDPNDPGGGGGNGNGGGTGLPPNPNFPILPGVCGTDMEIAQFLANNPGDESRLPQAFPCN